MVVEQKSNLSVLGIFPKCPFYNSVLSMVLTVVMLALGTVGIYFLNVWVAVGYLIYSMGYFFLAMPIKHCQYCYYKVQEPTIDSKEGKPIGKLLPKDQWKELYLTKHVQCAKNWYYNMFIIWLLPIVLIGLSFFLNYSRSALITLLGFIVVLAVNMIYMRQKVCTKCAIMEECHAAF